MDGAYELLLDKVTNTPASTNKPNTNLEFPSCVELFQPVQCLLSVHLGSNPFAVLKTKCKHHVNPFTHNPFFVTQNLALECVI